MKLERLNRIDMQPVISEERLLQIAQWIDIGFSIVLWLTYFLAILASFQHVAWAFSLLEAGEEAWIGFLAAAAVDGALAVMAYLIQQRRRQRHVAQTLGDPETAVEGTYALWFGLFFLGGISIIANFLHGAHIELDTETLTWVSLMRLDGLQWLRLATNAIALPLIVIFLGEVVNVPGANGLISDLVRRNQVLQEATQLLNSVRTELDRTKTSLQEALASVNTTRSELHMTQQELTTTRASLNMAEAEVNTLRTAMSAAEVESTTTCAALSAVQAELSEMRTELAITQEALTTTQADRHTKEALLTDVRAELVELKLQVDSLSIPVQEALRYLASQARGGDDTQEAAAQRAGGRLGKPVSRSVIGRIVRVLRDEKA